MSFYAAVTQAEDEVHYYFKCCSKFFLIDIIFKSKRTCQIKLQNPSGLDGVRGVTALKHVALVQDTEAERARP